MHTETRVFLADLRYNYSGVLANDCMPLGVAYMKAVMDRDLPEAESRLFAYPGKLEEALRQNAPDVLMLSDYCWNEALTLRFARMAKAIRPDTLVVVGGPNLSLEADRQTAFLAKHPEIDVYALGEGDFLAAEIVRRYLASGKSLAKLGAMGLPSSVYRAGGEIMREPAWERHKEVDEIPSPWLSGAQDEFFDGKLAPMVETNRGCPFTCTFCVQGTRWYTKVHNFSQERVKEELEYIARRIAERSPQMKMLRIADSNYGMFERDVEISGFIGHLQKQYGWPTFIDATTGKNRPDRIIKSVEQVSGALVLYQAVQSLDETVLRNVRRTTIKLEAYEQLQIHMRGRGLRSNSDLILGLPGETLETHLNAIHKLLDSEINQVHNFQLMLLKGSELESVESRNLFRFSSRFRVLPKNFGIYGEEKVFDVEEIVVETDTLSFDDYIQARKFHLTSSVFQNDGWFEDAVTYAARFGIKRSQWWTAMSEGLNAADGPVGEFVQNFVRETNNELFPTPEACIEFYKREDNFKRLRQGEIGDNLMYKYRAIASFFIWPEICDLAMRETRRVIEERAAQLPPDFAQFWDDFHDYEEARHAHGHTVEDILSSTSVILNYDIGGWVAAGCPEDYSPYRLEAPTVFEFSLSPVGRRELGAALNVWTTSLKGLSKMVTRVQAAWQVRDAHAQQNREACVAGV